MSIEVIKLTKLEKKRLENAFKVCEDIIRKGWSCMPEATQAKRAIYELLHQDGKVIERIDFKGPNYFW